ncbi:hypothetical protein [Mucilaginibacter jinjuensis]|uniref:Uncharacterized protein n=1 Tax=Mucilaginibacter jinjuensis TaxID=1176721 RepID=A0ABY7T3W0_9SPHI|nr:hypothetical protein [Mucilaginibacter jinjuensis]WCT11021.1 hypothetical protein PQO05_19985 [Mucilaginibacter jinjuensis]
MATQSKYFKFRGRFDFSPHRFEIGNPIIQNKALSDNFFLNKLYKLGKEEFSSYYNFHLIYFSKCNPEQEEEFFYHVTDIVISRIAFFKKKDPFSSSYPDHMATARQLEAFLYFLKKVDRWHKLAPIESVVAEKDRMIDQLNGRIADLEAQLKESTKYDAGEKIVIDKGSISTFMNLVHQIQDLKLPNNNRLARSQAQSPWYKMIAKYFKHGDKDISIDTAHNYFPANKDDKPSKYINIAEDDKLFKIVPKEKK